MIKFNTTRRETDTILVANRCGYRANTCGSVVEWSRRYLARRASHERKAA